MAASWWLSSSRSMVLGEGPRLHEEGDQVWDGIISKEMFDRPSGGGEAREETFEDGTILFVSWAFLEDVVTAVENLACEEINAGGAGSVVGLDEILVVLACVSVPSSELGEATHLWARELLEPGSRTKGGTEDEGGRVGAATLFYRI